MRLKEGEIVYLKNWFGIMQHNNKYGIKIGSKLKFKGYTVDNGGVNNMERGFLIFETHKGEEFISQYSNQYHFETKEERRKRIIKELCK